MNSGPVRVIDSCVTVDQLESAARYVTLWVKRMRYDPESWVAAHYHELVHIRMLQIKILGRAPRKVYLENRITDRANDKTDVKANGRQRQIER